MNNEDLDKVDIVKQQQEYEEFREFITVQYNEYVRSIMRKPIVGFLHRLFATKTYKYFLSIG